MRCHAGEVELLAPEFLWTLAELNTRAGIGLADAVAGGRPERTHGGWVELEALYRLRLSSAESAGAVARELGLEGPPEAEGAARLAVAYLRSRGCPL